MKDTLFWEKAFGVLSTGTVEFQSTKSKRDTGAISWFMIPNNIQELSVKNGSKFNQSPLFEPFSGSKIANFWAINDFLL